MADTRVRVEKEGAIAVLTINRPEAMNALDPELARMTIDILDGLEKEPVIRVLILTGVGKAFSAGADIRSMYAMSLQAAGDFIAAGKLLLDRIESSRIISIAAINGFALGGGLELALSCDLRIATEKARLGLPEVTVGLIPGWGGTQRLPRLIGKGKAKEFIFTGDLMSADEAYRLGLVNRVVPEESLMEAARGMATRIVANSPIAVERAKQVIDKGLEMPLAGGLSCETEAAFMTFATEDRAEGMLAFIEKRKPVYKGR